MEYTLYSILSAFILFHFVSQKRFVRHECSIAKIQQTPYPIDMTQQLIIFQVIIAQHIKTIGHQSIFVQDTGNRRNGAKSEFTPFNGDINIAAPFVVSMARLPKIKASFTSGNCLNTDIISSISLSFRPNIVFPISILPTVLVTNYNTNS